MLLASGEGVVYLEPREGKAGGCPPSVAPQTCPLPCLGSFLVCLSRFLLLIVLFAFSAPQFAGLPPVGNLQGRNRLTNGKGAGSVGGTSSTCPGEKPCPGLGPLMRVKFLCEIPCVLSPLEASDRLCPLPESLGLQV